MAAMPIRSCITLLFALLPCSLGAARQDAVYVASIQKWRAAHELRLRADDGWLSVVGLGWLKEGENRAGSAPGADIMLPAGTPSALGRFRLAGGLVTFEPSAGAAVEINGKPAAAQALRPDVDKVTAGSLTLFIIRRGDRFGIRVKDRNSAARRSFAGEQWYPARASWRVMARFEPASPGKTVPIANVLGQVANQASPGTAVFTIDGKPYRLDAIEEGRELFFIFKDGTSRDATYPAGRFLYTDQPRNGQVVLDFNKAENPPCAFTEFATCPLPPRQNQLPIRIEAGERYAAHR
jgi:uncharacterized protein (DUF1684 family)